MLAVVANHIFRSKTLFLIFDDAGNFISAETQAQADLFEIADREIKGVGFQIAGEKLANGLRGDVFRNVCSQTDRLFSEDAHHISGSFTSKCDGVILGFAHADVVVFVVADAPILRCFAFDVQSEVFLVHRGKMLRINCSQFLRIANSPGNQVGTLTRKVQLVDDEFFVSDRAEECIADAGFLTVDATLSPENLEGIGFCIEDVVVLRFLVFEKQNRFGLGVT